MQQTYTLTLAACLFGLLTACSSSSSSFSEQKQSSEPTEQPKTAEKAPEKEPEKAPEKEPDKEPEKEPLPTTPNNRTLMIVPSSEGGDAHQPLINDKGVAYYMSGPMDFGDSSDPTKVWDHRTVGTDKEMMNKAGINPDKVHTLVITSDNGTKLGEFRFVNQTYSGYATFSPEKTAPTGNPRHPNKNHENLATYVAEATKFEAVEKLNGTVTYTGHTLGYQDGPKGETPTAGYLGNVTLKADFDNKKISGEMTTRHDGLVKYHWQFMDTKEDAQGNEYDVVSAKGIALSRSDVPLILAETDIKSYDNGKTAGFRGEVQVNDGGTIKRVTDYNGAFAGPNAEEVVGQIGGGEERIMFGARQQH
ncbi:hypothetical protein OA57_02415 [Chelonobacter oris]|uniref:Transferrin-binding protein B C-lobe/N-lobe beta barrel domain-containing protein n=1 Tax=Chelonobacter oris TaxID=505317 RepID=A0A0A3BC38_9PAST|nr:transferrin-binding protein-like solute binding protein [Chelonobacter oris]KGQ71104.1 hypothetical protein OA57_02415 [Chelonobacter oris]